MIKMILFFHFICIWARYIVSNFSKSFNKDKVINDCKQENDFIEPEMPQFLTFKKDYTKYPIYKDGTLKFFPPVFIQRYETVALILQDFASKRRIRKVVDFGCAELGFFIYLKNIEGVNEILEVDIDSDKLEKHASKAAPLNSDYLMTKTKRPLEVYILAGSVADFDDHLIGCDAVIAIELIEHLTKEAFNKMPYNIFHNIKPSVAIFTTPNADFNSLFPNFTDLRHEDHKFEWNRKEFFNWTQEVLKFYPDYSVRFYGIGIGPEGTENLGCCTQMAVFQRSENTGSSVSAEENKKSVSKYKLIKHYEYPFYADMRTVEEKIIHEIQYQAAHLSKLDNFYNYDTSEIEIPLHMLKEYVSDLCPNEQDFLNILKNSGMLLRKRDNAWFLVHTEESNSSEITFAYDEWLNEDQLNEFCDSQELLEEKWSDDDHVFVEETTEFQSARSLEELKPCLTEKDFRTYVKNEGVFILEETANISPLRRSVPVNSSNLCSNIEIKKLNSIKSRIPLKKKRDYHVSVRKTGQPFKKIFKSCSLDSCLENVNCKTTERESYYLNLIPGGSSSFHRVTLFSSCRKKKVRSYSSSSLLSSLDKAGDSGYPFSFSPPTEDLTPEQVDELCTENEMSRSTSPSSDVDMIDVVNQRLRHDFFIEDIPVENGDLANNNRDGEGNNVEGLIGQRLVNEIAAERDPNDNLFFPEIEEFPPWLLNLGELAPRPVFFPLSDDDGGDDDVDDDNDDDDYDDDYDYDEGVVNDTSSDFNQSLDLEDLDTDF